MQLLVKNDARPSLKQPVRYQIVSFLFPICQTFFFYMFTKNVESYTLSDECFPLLYVRYLTYFFLVFTNINLIIRLPPLVGKDPECFGFQKKLYLKTEKILSTILSPIVKIFYAYRENFAFFDPV